MNRFLVCLISLQVCQAYKIKVRNHTNQEIKVVVDTVLRKKNFEFTVKPGKRNEIDTKLWTWRGIKVETIEGSKRKGSAGPLGSGCYVDDADKIFIFEKNGEDVEYLAGCKSRQTGNLDDGFFDVFLPEQGKFRVKKTVGHKDETIRDTGSNLVVVNRFFNTKY